MGKISVLSFLLSILLLAVVSILIMAVGNLLLQTNKFSELNSETYYNDGETSCTRDNQWSPEEAVVYVPSFWGSHFQNNETDAKITAELELLFISRRFHTVILDCPLNHGENYTTQELDLMLKLVKQNTETSILTEGPLHFWFLASMKGNLSVCVELAKAANHAQNGTVSGIVFPDKVLMVLAEGMTMISPIFKIFLKTTPWKALENETVKWAEHGLETGVMVSSVYCYELEYQIPKFVRERFSRTFYLDERPERFVVKNGIPMLTLSDDYKDCKNSLEGSVDLELAISETYSAKGANLRPYCLL